MRGTSAHKQLAVKRLLSQHEANF